MFTETSTSAMDGSRVSDTVSVQCGLGCVVIWSAHVGNPHPWYVWSIFAVPCVVEP